MLLVACGALAFEYNRSSKKEEAKAIYIEEQFRRVEKIVLQQRKVCFCWWDARIAKFRGRI